MMLNKEIYFKQQQNARKVLRDKKIIVFPLDNKQWDLSTLLRHVDN